MSLVLWSDEAKNELFGNKHSKWVWCKKKEDYTEKNLIPTVKYGERAVMMWGCFSFKGPGNVVRVYGITNCVKYQDIFNQNLAASAKKPGSPFFRYSLDIPTGQ